MSLLSHSKSSCLLLHSAFPRITLTLNSWLCLPWPCSILLFLPLSGYLIPLFPWGLFLSLLDCRGSLRGTGTGTGSFGVDFFPWHLAHSCCCSNFQCADGPPGNCLSPPEFSSLMKPHQYAPAECISTFQTSKSWVNLFLTTPRCQSRASGASLGLFLLGTLHFIISWGHSLPLIHCLAPVSSIDSPQTLDIFLIIVITLCWGKGYVLMSAMSKEARRGCQTLWSCSYRQSWVMSDVGTGNWTQQQAFFTGQPWLPKTWC